MATQTTEITYPLIDSQATTSFIDANVAEADRTGDIQTDLKKALISLLGLSGSGYSLDDLWKRYQLSSSVTGDADVRGGPSRTPPKQRGQHLLHFLPPGRLRNPGNANGFPGTSGGATAPEFTLGDDIGVTNGDGFTTGSNLTMPVNTFSAGEQIVVVSSYNWGANYTYADQPSDNIDGTTGWKLIGYWGDATSDHWCSVWTKTASGGETAITYATHATVDLVAFVMRRTAATAVDLLSISRGGGQHIITSTVVPDNQPAPVDGVSHWRVQMVDNSDEAGFAYTDSTGWTELATENDEGATPTQSLSVYTQDTSTAGTEVSGTTCSTTNQSGKRQDLIAFSLKTEWARPRIVSYTHSTGTASSSSAHTITLPSNLATGDLLLFYWQVMDDSGTYNPVINSIPPDEAGAVFQRYPSGDTSVWYDTSNAGTDHTMFLQYRLVDGTEASTYDVYTENINPRSVEATILHITDNNVNVPFSDYPWVFNNDNTATTSDDLPLYMAGPNALSVFSLSANGGTFSWDTPPTNAVEYATTSSNQIHYFHNRGTQEIDQYGTLAWTNATSSPCITYVNILPRANTGGTDLTSINMETLTLDSTDNPAGGYGSPTGIAMKGDGLNIVAGNDGNDLYTIPLGTAYDITSSTTLSGTVASDISRVRSISFAEDGAHCLLCDYSGLDLNYYDLSADPYNIEAAVAAGDADTKKSSLANITGARFGDSGNKLYVNLNTTTMKEYDLSTPYDISTAGTAQDTALGSNSYQDFVFNEDGTRLYTLENVADSIQEWILLTPWDTSTAVAGYSFALTVASNNPTGICYVPTERAILVSWYSATTAIQKYTWTV